MFALFDRPPLLTDALLAFCLAPNPNRLRIIPASHDITIHTLQSLDPQALADLFSHVKDISVAVCLGIS